MGPIGKIVFWLLVLTVFLKVVLPLAVGLVVGLLIASRYRG